MTSGPRLYRGSKRRGIVAVALFALFAIVFLQVSAGDGTGFEGGSVTAGIGFLRQLFGNIGNFNPAQFFDEE